MAPAASQASRAEALGFHKITPDEDARLHQVFGWVEVLPMDEAVEEAAATEARNPLGIPGAIAYTALPHGETGTR